LLLLACCDMGFDSFGTLATFELIATMGAKKGRVL
jgi:hypothetical protein